MLEQYTITITRAELDMNSHDNLGYLVENRAKQAGYIPVYARKANKTKPIADKPY